MGSLKEQKNSFGAKESLKVGSKSYTYFSLANAYKTLGDLSLLPYSLKILLENLLRFENGRSVTKDDVTALAQWLKDRTSNREIAFSPARVLMQDFTGVPAVVDLATMRDALKSSGHNPESINPLIPVDLVIDHSVMIDAYGTPDAFQKNVDLEFSRNAERYAFLKWGQQSLKNFRVVPPGTGICHQVNLEYLAQGIWTEECDGATLAYPDTLVGTDSHTTMINGLGVLGWGVGGIEAEAAMLGQPLSMLIPEVIGFKFTGSMPEGTTATDLVLTVTQILRSKGVVGKFVEFYGAGLDNLRLADRATIANMAPEYGATCGIFPVDQETLRYLEFTGRDSDRVALVEAYAKAQGFWRDAKTPDPLFTDTITLDLGTIVPTIAGPKRPQDKVLLKDAPASCLSSLNDLPEPLKKVEVSFGSEQASLTNGDVVIAAITSCTNTSNPAVLVAAGLLARKAYQLGLKSKPWVKTSLAPGSQVVTDYLKAAGLDKDLESLGFYTTGYGCTTCIGNSGPLSVPVSQAIDAGDLTVSAILSGNRNFEGRIHPQVKLNYLASPPLVVAYAIAGSMTIDLTKDALGKSPQGTPIYLKDIWPSNKEIQDCMAQYLTPQMFKERYANVFLGNKEWQLTKVAPSVSYAWDEKSTYVKKAPYFENMPKEGGALKDIQGAQCLALLGDSITTDHISPAGSIKKDGPAGQYLESHGVGVQEFNSYGARRGNHEVMMRGTFANIRLQNEMTPEKSGGVTTYIPTGTIESIYDASMKYQKAGTPLVIVAGKEYGTGSSRDWAAKGTMLLGVKAVIAESFERIHRSNLVGMGILPLVFPKEVTRKSLALTGHETYNLMGLENGLKPFMPITWEILYPSGEKKSLSLTLRIDTEDEVVYYKNGGILHYMVRQLSSH